MEERERENGTANNRDIQRNRKCVGQSESHMYIEKEKGRKQLVTINTRESKERESASFFLRVNKERQRKKERKE